MKKNVMRWPLWAVAILLAASGYVGAQPESTPPPPSAPPAVKGAKEIVWGKIFSAALEKAKAEGKPLMVDFYATWCGACKMMDEKTYTDAAVIAEASRFINVKVDVEAQEEVAQKFGVTALPTTAWLRADGTILRAEEGMVPPREFAEIMRATYQQWEQK